MPVECTAQDNRYTSYSILASKPSDAAIPAASGYLFSHKDLYMPERLDLFDM